MLHNISVINDILGMIMNEEHLLLTYVDILMTNFWRYMLIYKE